MLESKEITKQYGRKTAVDHVSLALEPGHLYAMLGPNGSGKTTWMKMAAGLVKPSYGQMLYNGAPIGPASKQAIAYMSTEPYFYSWMSAAEVGTYYQDFFSDFSVDLYRQLLEEMNLEADAPAKTLSSGMMAKLKIAVTLARDARVIMLDEPLNGIDLLARDVILKTVLRAANETRILLLSSHLVEELEAVADMAIFMKDSHLIEVRSVEELRETEGKSIADRYREIYG